MKINIQKISIKNFLSVGSNELVLEYTKGVHAIMGKIVGSDVKNGVGKSCVGADAIVFALFGKSLRKVKKIEHVVNSLNREKCEVKIWFTVNSVQYRVERGLKPGYLRFYIGDKEEPEELGEKRGTQTKIETVLGVSFSSFLNLITLNINSSTPFFQMTTAEKRVILEDIMNLSIYGKMFDHIKRAYNESKNNKRVLVTEHNAAREIYQSKKGTFDKLEGLRSQFEDNKSKELDTLNTKIDKKNGEIQNYLEGITDKNYDDISQKINDNILKCNSMIQKCQLGIENCQTQISKDQKVIKSLEENPICVICGTPTTDDHVEKHKQEKVDECNKNKEKIEKYRGKIEEIRAKLSEYKDKSSKIKDLISKQNRLQNQLKDAQRELKSLQNERDNVKSKQFSAGSVVSVEDVDKSKLQYEIKGDELDNETNNLLYYDNMKDLFGDKGIKNYVIRKAVPVINKKINEYLQMMKADYSLKFDDELNEDIRSRGCDAFSYNSFSSGEQKRIDLALMVTLIDIAKSRSSIDCNILLLDEVLDSSLCVDGTQSFMSYLKNQFKNKYPELCLYVITHKTEIIEGYFDSIIDLKKENGFTKIHEIRKIEGGLEP